MSLRGQLLVAAPDLVDPNFRRAVVLVTEHGDEGAMGLVLNRPTEAAVGEAAPELAALAGEMDLVHVGGPVQPRAVTVLAEFDEPAQAAHLVTADIGFVPADADLAVLAATTRRARVFAGYAGWSPGQLEAELEDEGWLVVGDTRPEDLFGTDADGLWSAVLRRQGGHLALVARMPEDPSQN
jgi:putative transcriptional regulator